MKSIVINVTLLIIFFTSCTKKERVDPLANLAVVPVPAINTTPDSLRGREFVLDSLEWTDNEFGYPTFDMIDSNYFQPGYQINLEIKHDTSNVWELVNYYNGGQASFGYLYNMAVGVLYVWPNPALPALIGKRFSLRVKFL